MAQDKIAEIINFKSGAGAPGGAQTPAAALDECEHAGAYLAANRDAAGLSVDQVSEEIKVKASHIAAIEVMRADLLPTLPYASGFVKSYARYLGLDADRVAARFRSELAALNAAMPQEQTSPDPTGPTSADGARLAWVFAVMAVVMFVLWVGFQVLSGPQENSDRQGPKVVVGSEPAAKPALRQRENAPAVEAAPANAAETAPAEMEAPVVADTDLSEGVAQEIEVEAEPEAAPADSPIPAQGAEDVSSPSETAPVQEEEQASQTPAAETEPATAAPVEARPAPRVLPRRPRPSPPVVTEASLIRSVAPDYPERCARGAAAMESVTLMFDVSAAGRAVNMRVVTSTDSCFHDEALRALARWRFTPRTVDGAASLETGKSATLNFRK